MFKCHVMDAMKACSLIWCWVSDGYGCDVDMVVSGLTLFYGYCSMMVIQNEGSRESSSCATYYFYVGKIRWKNNFLSHGLIR